MQTDRGCKILPGNARAVTRVTGMTEVRVSIDVDKAGRSSMRKREAGCQEKTAVASQYER
jgi:hypothetical protein